MVLRQMLDPVPLNAASVEYITAPSTVAGRSRSKVAVNGSGDCEGGVCESIAEQPTMTPSESR